MHLGTQELGKQRFEKALVARKHKAEARKKSLLIALSLTAMVDMFSVLVVFLLQTFSASPDLLITKGVQLPVAESGVQITDAPVLSISGDGIYLDQKFIGETLAVLKDPNPLMEKLVDLRDAWMKSHPDEAFQGEINLQADREVPSTVVSQIMGLVPGQAYSSIRLAVISGSPR